MDKVQLTAAEESILDKIVAILVCPPWDEALVVASKMKALLAGQSLPLIKHVIDAIMDDASGDGLFHVQLCRDLSMKLAQLATDRPSPRRHTTFHKVLCQRISDRIDAWCAMRAAYGTADIAEAAQLVQSATWLMGKLYGKRLASKKLMLKSMSQLLRVDDGRDSDEEMLEVSFACLSNLLMAYTLRRSAELPKHTETLRKCFTHLQSSLAASTLSAQVRAQMKATVDMGRQVFPHMLPVALAVQPLAPTPPPAQAVEEHCGFVLLPEEEEQEEEEEEEEEEDEEEEGSQPETVSIRSQSDTVTSSEALATSETKLQSEASAPSTSGQSWAIRPTKKAASSTKADYTAVFQQLVELYGMRQLNFDRLTDIDVSCSLATPTLQLAEWLYRSGTDEERTALRGRQERVDRLMDDAQRSLRQEMEGYHAMLDQAMERHIDGLVQGLPAPLRAETNQRAYDAAMEKLGQAPC